jgi:hypothetical protein
VICAITKFGGE